MDEGEACRGNQAAGAPVDGIFKSRARPWWKGKPWVVYMDYLLKPLAPAWRDTPGFDLPDGRAGSESGHRFSAHARRSDDPARDGRLCLPGRLDLRRRSCCHKGGKKMASRARSPPPPRNSHEVLQPAAYINGEKLPAVRIPDMGKTLTMNMTRTIRRNWRTRMCRPAEANGERKVADGNFFGMAGGAYVTFRRKDKEVAEVAPSTNRSALLYFFAMAKRRKPPNGLPAFIARAVAQRYQQCDTVETGAPPCAERPSGVGGADCHRGGAVIAETLERQTKAW